MTKHIQTFDDLCTCGMPWPCSMPEPGTVTVTLDAKKAREIAYTAWKPREPRLIWLAAQLREALDG